MSKYINTPQVLKTLCDSIGCRPAESGALLGSADGRTIEYIYYDHAAQTTSTAYSPDIKAINRVKNDWNDKGIKVVGFAHSHPGNHNHPSSADVLYGKRIMEALGMNSFYMPIINVSDPPDGNIKVYPYYLNKRGRVRRQPEISVKAQNQSHGRKVTVPTSKDIFARVKRVYPLEVLRQKTVVCIGCGGARELIEELARSGIRNFVLIDGDTVNASNVATQRVYVSEIGKYKVDALKGRILDINPEANVTAVPRFLDDAMSDKNFEITVGEALIKASKDVLIVGCTDSFHAQARTAALAVKYGTPYLAAQIYKGGTAGEVYFSYPGVTNNGCPHCALRSRYEAYANGFKNDVTSEGAPIFAGSRVNSLMGQIAMMLLLYEAKGCVYGDMLDQVADRNFVMTRMSPRADKELGINIFQEILAPGTDLSFFGETAWIPQEPVPSCPLCGGIGDLTPLKGKVHDTRTDW